MELYIYGIIYIYIYIFVLFIFCACTLSRSVCIPVFFLLSRRQKNSVCFCRISPNLDGSFISTPGFWVVVPLSSSQQPPRNHCPMKLDVIHVPDVHDSFTARAPLRDRNDQKAETTNACPSIFARTPTCSPISGYARSQTGSRSFVSLESQLNKFEWRA